MSGPVGPVEHVVTGDGVSIAYQSFGQGPPVLAFPAVGFPLRVFEEMRGRGLRNELHRECSLVSWDSRGLGMSDRSVVDFSMEAWVADAVAVAETFGAPVPVYATTLSGPIAITFASQRPDLVSHLVLSDAGVSGKELATVKAHRAYVGLLEIDFDLWAQFVARTVLRLAEPEASAVVDAFHSETDADLVLQAMGAAAAFDATAVAATLDVPTLIIEQPGLTYDRDDVSRLNRDLSRLISGARLLRARDLSDTADQILAALFGGSGQDVHGAFRSIMFTDLVSSTAITQRVGDDAAQLIVETHDAAVREALAGHNGVQVKHTGDGIMAAFDSATDAARAAQLLVRQLGDAGVGVRVGLNAGEPIERDGDLFGTAVQLAARLGDAAGDGQVLATQVVRDLTAGKGLTWSAAPAIDAKGFEEPVSVFTLDLD